MVVVGWPNLQDAIGVFALLGSSAFCTGLATAWLTNAGAFLATVEPPA